jgi:predicted deacylase
MPSKSPSITCKKVPDYNENLLTTPIAIPMTYSAAQIRIHQFAALESGPRLIVLGAVHGIETCGTQGIERVLAELDSGALQLTRGLLTLVPVANALAYQRRQRNGDRNLNRNLRPCTLPQDNEDRIANTLCPLLARHDVLLDLHSFKAGSEPFAMLGPPNNNGILEPFGHAALEESLALRLGPRRIVEGWLATYAAGVTARMARTPPTERAALLSTDPCYGVGTTEYMRTQGGYAITLECGQNTDPVAAEVAYRAIRNALAHLGLIDAPAPPVHREIEFLRLAQVYDRFHAGDRFVKPWSSYDQVKAGEPMAVRNDGALLCAPEDGFVVFPDADASPGNEWFYFAQRSARDITGAAAPM